MDDTLSPTTLQDAASEDTPASASDARRHDCRDYGTATTATRRALSRAIPPDATVYVLRGLHIHELTNRQAIPNDARSITWTGAGRWHRLSEEVRP